MNTQTKIHTLIHRWNIISYFFQLWVSWHAWLPFFYLPSFHSHFILHHLRFFFFVCYCSLSPFHFVLRFLVPTPLYLSLQCVHVYCIWSRFMEPVLMSIHLCELHFSSGRIILNISDFLPFFRTPSPEQTSHYWMDISTRHPSNSIHTKFTKQTIHITRAITQFTEWNYQWDRFSSAKSELCNKIRQRQKRSMENNTEKSNANW